MSDYDITTDANGCIKNGLRADIMRCCMENKNLLAEEGSLYVGTGEKIVIGEGIPNRRITIARTAALSPGNYGEILMVDGNNLHYSKLSEANFYCDSDGVVQGDVGESPYPAKEACNIYKQDLYNSYSASFRGTSFYILVDLPVNNTPFRGYMSIITANRSIDFGFIFFPTITVGAKSVLYPINSGNNFRVPDPSASSNYKNRTLFYAVATITQILTDQMRIDIRLYCGSRAANLFPTTTSSPYSLGLIKEIPWTTL